MQIDMPINIYYSGPKRATICERHLSLDREHFHEQIKPTDKNKTYSAKLAGHSLKRRTIKLNAESGNHLIIFPVHWLDSLTEFEVSSRRSPISHVIDCFSHA